MGKVPKPISTSAWGTPVTVRTLETYCQERQTDESNAEITFFVEKQQQQLKSQYLIHNYVYADGYQRPGWVT